MRSSFAIGHFYALRIPLYASIPPFPSPDARSPYIRAVIDTDEKLAAFLPQLATAAWIALDTEADSLHAYPEKLCLIQISIVGHDVLIDPLARVNLAPLFGILSQHQLILHGADYDLRLLRKYCGFVPTAIFDTMLASRLLGCREFGLVNLVAKYLGAKLEKGPQKANWARRPLTPRMAEYARHDTLYLKPLTDLLTAELTAKGRLEWHRQACARLIADATEVHAPDPNEVWRVKGSHLLPPPALAVLRAIWHWREQEAIASNRPPFFILSPDAMVGLAAEAEARFIIVIRHFFCKRQYFGRPLQYGGSTSFYITIEIS